MWSFMILGINYYLSISDAPHHLIPPQSQMICCAGRKNRRRATKLEKLFPNKSFDLLCCCSLSLVIIYFYIWTWEQSYHILLRKKLPPCRIFHVNVPLIEIYDISTLVLYIFIIFYDDDIFFITHAHLILSFIFRSYIAASPYTKVAVVADRWKNMPWPC